MTVETKDAPRLKQLFDSTYRDELMSELQIQNIMQVPSLDKIVVNMGIGEALVNSKHLESAANELALIAGQKPVITQAKKSISTFKLREGNDIGCKVTLRGAKMWEFFDRLISLAIPRIRDFRGLSPRSFDGNGNYTFGLNEQLMFPESNYDSVDQTRGMDITIVTSATSNEHAKALLEKFNFPFRKEGNN